MIHPPRSLTKWQSTSFTYNMTRCGFFDTPAATGTQTITGLGFRPTFAMFFHSMQTTDGAEADACLNQGYAVEIASVITQHARSGRSQEGGVAGSTEYGSGASQTLCIRGNTTTTTLNLEAALTEFNDDGFVLNYTTVPAAATRVFYVAVLIESLGVGIIPSLALPFGVSTPVTGLSFQPQMVMGMHRGSDSCNLGFGTPGSEFSMMSRNRDNVAFGFSPEIWSSTGSVFLSGYGGRDDSVNLTAINADGFSVIKNLITDPRPDFYWLALADTAASFAAGSFVPPQSGTTTITGLGFQPALLLLIGMQGIGISSAYNNQLGFRNFFGAVDSDGNQWCCGQNATTLASQPRYMSSTSATVRHGQLTNAHTFTFNEDGFDISTVVGAAGTDTCAFLAFGARDSSGALPLLGVG